MYAAAARYRRRYYARRPHLRRRLRRPVISIGNLAVGGRGKTPLAAYVAARLQAFGERPAILSRGYGRRRADDATVVVRDREGIRADLDRAGDEPLMLARQLDGVVVMVSRQRYPAGRLAEDHFGCTVHVLDDGFQHFDLYRDADLVVIAQEDLDGRTLPAGRLREPIDAAAAADAFVAIDGTILDTLASGRPVWRARRVAAREAFLDTGSLVPAGAPVVALAGIANPAAFFHDVRAAGWPIVREVRFRDHHRYSRHDVTAIAGAAEVSRASCVLTTEKDFVRLLPFRPFPVPIGYLPLTIAVDRAPEFDDWLRAVLEKARG